MFNGEESLAKLGSGSGLALHGIRP